MNKRFVGMAVLLCAVVLAGQAFAQGPGHGMGPGGDMGPGFRGPGMMLGNLDLTDAQKEQVKSLMTAFHTAAEPYRTQMQDLGKEMRTATANGAFDESQIRAIAQKQSQVQVELTVLNEKLRSDIYQILTPEQRTKVDEEQTRMQNRMRQGMSRPNK
jgi:periplasmic protein CpxP/Spy